MRPRYPLHIHISTLFLALIILVAGALGGIGYRLSRELLDTSAADLTARISEHALLEMRRIIEPAEVATRLLSLHRAATAASFEERLESIGFLRQALDSSPALSSLYIGDDGGSFFLLGRIGQGSATEAARAPAGAAYVVQSIERRGAVARGRFIYLDHGLKVLREDDRPDYPATYDPRQRPWFIQGLRSPTPIKTPPYLFFPSQRVGTTLALRTANARAVVGADILLHTLGKTLASMKVTPGSEMALVNQDGYLLAYEEPDRILLKTARADGMPTLARLDQVGSAALAPLLGALRQIDDATRRGSRFSVDGQTWRASLNALSLEGIPPLYLAIAIPENELMAGALRLIRHSAAATLLVLLLAFPLTWLLARSVSRSLRSLAGEAEAIRHFEFAHPIVLDSSIREVSELAMTMEGMKRTIHRFLEITQTVAAEQNFDRLLPRLLIETLRVSGTHAGVLYLADDQELRPAAAVDDRGRQMPADLSALDGASAGPLLGAALADGIARAARLTSEDRTCLRMPPGELPDATHAIAVPLRSRKGELLGVMLLFCVGPTDSGQLSFVRALSASAAVSLESKSLIKAQKDLFEAFIQLIASAIDAKSPYTGGHCARVPELTKMLARAACEATSGPYRDFALGEDDWEAVHVAAWLHDCGKVTTPEYVVDKATKLETIHDRIHEIRMRFEVLKRDAEIRCLEAIARGESGRAARDRLDSELRQIDDDFAFVASCNEGGEFMAPDKVTRLQAIARRTWLRTLDDRIGIAEEEKRRKAQAPRMPLPVVEPLLADKSEHRVLRQEHDRIPEDNRWGFRMKVPELLYNRGELYNLTTGRGTLSEEERYKINEHIVQTLIMLSQLPFPRHLRQVPEIAGGHHEKLDGTGYPRRLTSGQMSPLARMMAIADIFEALTAVDRPYKKGKTLSEALAIMSRMQREQHIDPDLFALFLRAGVHAEYARRFMRPEQIDAVDVEGLLAGIGPNPGAGEQRPAAGRS
ncbi:HD domain-containing phosphohydrolase [Accumulibacter sp.]|uniref:HD domain-containing phosphohydrolase n=1 Tax=Accumulibacter sp. TaxID=2053492 RepID=UPI0025DE5659|nr:HD domain-containing phosphohydrolase [Accumulibacter sp.]MCM8596578.1 phosphohydrolase [Accumulibacter sp.]MDS4050726.1 HD domain-containing phosphohydrolase [Accumulibacter sp.]